MSIGASCPPAAKRLPRGEQLSGSENLSGRQRTLLVTTALEATWGTDQPILFLGEWCKLPLRHDAWGPRAHRTVPFHWDDVNKLKADYAYLHALHRSLLHGLAAALNAWHGVQHPIRYWQLLLDPWLLTYVNVMFDRYDCLRAAFESGETFDMLGDAEAELPPPRSYSSFVTAVLSDDWNAAFCMRIVRDEYAGQAVIRPPVDAAPVAAATVADWQPRELLAQSVALVDRALGLLPVRHDVVFASSYFSAPALCQLQLAIGQVPRLFLQDFQPDRTLLDQLRDTPAVDRSDLELPFVAESPFERFVARWIARDLPLSVVEHYRARRDRAQRVPLDARVIVTANGHWTDEGFKSWCAERINRGAKLVVLEHGGSLPAYQELFEFEEDIADVRGTWFTPYHPKHVKVPPSKLVGRKNRKPSPSVQPERQYCAVIDNEYPRYVYRAHFYAMAGQGLAMLDLTARWYAALDDRVSQHVKIKPFPYSGPGGWNAREIYQQRLGADKVLSERSLSRVFARSRLLVCTCPETVFAEAMMSDVPTVLIYDDQLFLRHKAAQPLLDLLRAARIVFHDPILAAGHVNEVWDDPEVWWSSPIVTAARRAFRQQALHGDGDWCQEWVAFLQDVVKMV